MGARLYPAQHHLGELDTTLWAFICVCPAEGPFQSHGQRSVQTLIPLHEGTFLRSPRC